MPSTVPAVAPSADLRAGDSPRATPPGISLVIPVHDGGAAFERCLDAVERLVSPPSFEVLVVDDGSCDGSGQLASARGARVLRQTPKRGPAAARNLGARAARGEILFFLDADCEIRPDALAQAERAFAADPGLAALFGSYDADPAAPGAVSQFKNLYHHWTHQRGAEEAGTFWAGCGAIRRQRFLALGGFDERRYAEPSIEDIELGYRLHESGGRIRLLKSLQVRHLKRWTLGALVRTDVWRRGVPWLELLAERPGRGGELNLGWRGRVEVAAGLTLVGAALGGLAVPLLWPVAAVAGGTLVAATASFYTLVLRRRGVVAALTAVPPHLVYCLCCAAALAAGAPRFFAARRRTRGSGDV
jgi:GT2 family glycosyltransferase